MTPTTEELKVPAVFNPQTATLAELATRYGVTSADAERIQTDLRNVVKHYPEEAFIESFREMVEAAHLNACNKGFWDGGQRNFGEAIGLMHSELSEALDADRNGNPPDDKIPEFNGVTAEFADTVIRIMDWAGSVNMPLGEAIVAKMLMNSNRERKHGKRY